MIDNGLEAVQTFSRQVLPLFITPQEAVQYSCRSRPRRSDQSTYRRLSL
jgi:hypothetical protein